MKIHSTSSLRRILRPFRDRIKYGYLTSSQAKRAVQAFHKIFYDYGALGKTWKDTFWFGVRVLKNPFDLWIYQEILYDVKPTVIIETGTGFGGSALFLATLCDILKCGKIFSIDIAKQTRRPVHPRISYIHGSSVSPKVINSLKHKIKKNDRVLVILDSDHRYSHVLAELKSYAPMVTKGSYIIVEDGNLNGHPVEEDYGPGPYEAIKEFLRHERSFIIDESREKFLFTFNPIGYLKKISY